MRIIIDTREQKISHIVRYFYDNKINYDFMKLNFGDYTTVETFEKVVIERKNGLDELKANLCTKLGRKRFIKEFAKARRNKVEFYLLIENAKNYNDILTMKNKIKALNYVSNAAYFNIFHDFFHHQNRSREIAGLNKIKIIFCQPEDTGEKIVEILKKYL